jgi:lipopolysaccharide transport system permease protein
VIDAKDRAKVVDLNDLKQYRDLLFFLVWRDVKALYAQSVLGFGWAIIRPVFQMVIMTLVFGMLANVPSDNIDYPLFSYAAQLPWMYFSTALSASTASMITGGTLLSKVYFPRVFMPLTPVLTGLVDLLIAAVIMFPLMAWYKVPPTWNLLLLPVPVVLMVLTAAGCGFWLSALAVQFRDVKHGVQFMSVLLMYAAPVIYPSSLIISKFPEHGELIRQVYALYPLVGVIEGFRACFISAATNPPMPMPWDLIGIGYISATLLAVTGLVYFKHRERVFADVA